jgi:hypothetical protein
MHLRSQLDCFDLLPSATLCGRDPLSELAREASWVHVYCEALGCRHIAPLRLGDMIARFR